MTNKQPSKQEIIDAIKKKADKVKQVKQKQPNQTYIQPTQTINKVQSRDVQIVKQITKPSIESRMSNIIDNRCRYWIENRISQLLSSDNFTTREGYSFSIDNDRAAAPLLYQAQKWLREEKKIFVDVIFQGVNDRGNYDYEWCVTYNAWFDDSEDYNACRYEHNTSKKYYRTYEEALLEGIKEAVKLLKEEK